MTATPKKILIAVGNGFAFRYFLSSGLASAIGGRGNNVELLGDEGFAVPSQFKFIQGNRQIVAAIDSTSRTKRYCQLLRANFLPKSVECNTIWQFRQQELSKCGYIKKLILGSCWFFLRHIAFVRRILIKIETKVSQVSILDGALSSGKFDAVIVGGFSGFKFDEIVGKAANRRGIPVVAAILSWDNLSGLGYRYFSPDLTLVWSEKMREEAVRIHRCDERKVRIVGAIPFFKHFEILSGSLTSSGRCRKSGERLNVSFLSKSPKRFSFNLALFKRIHSQVRAIGLDVHWFVRLHPLSLRTHDDGRLIFQNEIDGFRDHANKFGNVELSLPEAKGTRVIFDDPDNDLSLYLSILERSDLVISMFSTAMLECALLGKMTVNICVPNSIFEISEATGSQVVSDRQDLYSDFNQDHIQAVLDVGEIETFYSVESLVEKIHKLFRRDRFLVDYPKTKLVGGLNFDAPVKNALSEISEMLSEGESGVAEG
mgnify:CR=1 FL=1